MVSKSTVLIILFITNYLTLTILAIEDKSDFHNKVSLKDEFSNYLESSKTITNEFLNVQFDSKDYNDKLSDPKMVKQFSKLVNTIIISQNEIDSHYKVNGVGDTDNQTNSTSHLSPYSICVYLLLLIISILLSFSLLLL